MSETYGIHGVTRRPYIKNKYVQYAEAAVMKKKYSNKPEKKYGQKIVLLKPMIEEILNNKLGSKCIEINPQSILEEVKDKLRDDANDWPYGDVNISDIKGALNFIQQEQKIGGGSEPKDDGSR